MNDVRRKYLDQIYAMLFIVGYFLRTSLVIRFYTHHAPHLNVEVSSFEVCSARVWGFIPRTHWFSLVLNAVFKKPVIHSLFKTRENIVSVLGLNDGPIHVRATAGAGAILLKVISGMPDFKDFSAHNASNFYSAKFNALRRAILSALGTGGPNFKLLATSLADEFDFLLSLLLVTAIRGAISCFSAGWINFKRLAAGLAGARDLSRSAARYGAILLVRKAGFVRVHLENLAARCARDANILSATASIGAIAGAFASRRPDFKGFSAGLASKCDLVDRDARLGAISRSLGAGGRNAEHLAAGLARYFDLAVTAALFGAKASAPFGLVGVCFKYLAAHITGDFDLGLLALQGAEALATGCGRRPSLKLLSAAFAGELDLLLRAGAFRRAELAISLAWYHFKDLAATLTGYLDLCFVMRHSSISQSLA